MPGYERVNALYGLIFAEGRKFLTYSFLEEYAESQARLDAIVREGHERTIAELGGTPIYQALKEAHAEYGEVLGVTARVDAAVDPQGISFAGCNFKAASHCSHQQAAGDSLENALSNDIRQEPPRRSGVRIHTESAWSGR